MRSTPICLLSPMMSLLLKYSAGQEFDLFPAGHKEHPGKKIELDGGDKHGGGKVTWWVTVGVFHGIWVLVMKQIEQLLGG